MITNNWKTWLLVFLLGLLVLWAVNTSFAKQNDNDKIVWCHCEPNGNCQTLELPQQALENAGHMSAQGNPLHAGDHIGACVEPTVTPTTVEPTHEATPSPTIQVTSTPTSTPTPSTTPVQRITDEIRHTETPTSIPFNPAGQCVACGGVK